ncbi:MAG: hypothetical protein KatS3mg105_1849 [Gemmatales bacterium]|nr:MAG: hypothetical protein KatS3mg105_1849 [Gemmatales bacterium]
MPACLTVLTLAVLPQANVDAVASAPAVAAKIDSFMMKHWQSADLKAAEIVDDSGFLRRVTLDIAGRIPTYAEARAFAEDQSPDKRIRVIQRLLASPEFPLHWSYVLDDMIQDNYAGDRAFIEYLRESLARRKGWDQIFKEIMIGPWDKKETEGASRYLVSRLKKLDEMTNDTSVVFFGVNVSCAKCHDHPLVQDWKQDHYYGMASFFNRTTKGNGKNGIAEKGNANVSFTTRKGEKKTAKLMFLSNRIIEEPAKPPKNYSRRAELVKVALEDPRFFRRAIVNRVWHYLFGRGLVHPVDQLHSANLPSVPDVLEWLADDFAAHGYRLDRLLAGITTSQTYQRSSRSLGVSDSVRDGDFAKALLRPLSPRQFAVSMVLATSEQTAFDSATEPEKRLQACRNLEGQAGRLLAANLLDKPSDDFQSSANEALFMSNNEAAQQLVVASGKNLTAQLAEISDSAAVVDRAIWTILSRAAEPDEREFLVKWLDSRSEDRRKACAQLVWALLTSAEFRFNH